MIGVLSESCKYEIATAESTMSAKSNSGNVGNCGDGCEYVAL